MENDFLIETLVCTLKGNLLGNLIQNQSQMIFWDCSSLKDNWVEMY